MSELSGIEALREKGLEATLRECAMFMAMEGKAGMELLLSTSLFNLTISLALTAPEEENGK